MSTFKNAKAELSKLLRIGEDEVHQFLVWLHLAASHPDLRVDVEKAIDAAEAKADIAPTPVPTPEPTAKTE